MRRSSLVLGLLVLVELGAAALWGWLVLGLRTGRLTAAGGDTAQAIATVSSTLGGVMGVVGVVMLFAWFRLRRQEG